MVDSRKPPLDIETVRQHITDWAVKRLSVPHPHFNNLPPCPYAARALQGNKVDIHTAPGSQLVERIFQFGRTWDDSFEMKMVVADRTEITEQELIEATSRFNEEFRPLDLMSNFDHPHAVQPRYKVTVTNGRYALAIVQRLQRFVDAARPLFARGYFKNVRERDLSTYVSYQGNYGDLSDRGRD